MMQRSIFLIPLLTASLCIQAQTTRSKIRGTLQDSMTGATLEDATVILLSIPDLTPARQLRSRKNGFVFHSLKPGNYFLIGSYLGYKSDSLFISIHQGDSTEVQAKLLLQPSFQTLGKVVVSAPILPMTIKRDTITFNTGAYPTPPYSTLEDLLKKLPGVEVDMNGNVTMQGRPVDKIYLDGKEFFLKDLKTATQNLPADIVARLETYDTQTDQGKFTGIRDNTGGRTLNIRLKDDRKKGFFGNGYTGAGNNAGYTVGGSATSLAGPRWLMGALTSDNINSQFTGTENTNGPGNGGVQTYTNGIQNYRDDWSRKLSATLNATENSAHATLISSSQRQTFLTDSTLLENHLSNSSLKNRAWSAGGSLDYILDSFTTVVGRFNIGQQTTTASSRDSVSMITKKMNESKEQEYLASTGETLNSSSTKSLNFSNSLDFRHRFRKPGRTLYLGLTGSSQNQDLPSHLYSIVNTFDSTGGLLKHTLLDQQSTQHSNSQGLGTTLAYTEPLDPHHILDFGYQMNTSTGHSNKQSFDYDSVTVKYDVPDTLTTNRFLNRVTIQRFNGGFNATGGAWRYQLGVVMLYTTLSNDNYTQKLNIIQRLINWYPRAGLVHDFANSGTLKLDYAGNSTSPTIDQLQPLPDLTNPYLIKIGNPALKQQFDHSLGLGYNHFNVGNLTNWQISLGGNYIEHQIAASTMALPGGIQQQEYKNVEGSFSLSSAVTYGFPLGSKKGNGSIDLHGRWGHDINFINGILNTTTASALGGRVHFNYHEEEKLFVDVSASLDLTGSHYSIDPVQNTTTYQQGYRLNITYQLPLSFTFNSYYNLQVSGSSNTAQAQEVSLWNASLYKTLFKDHSGQLRFSAFDLLGGNSNYTQMVGTNYLETRQANLPGRLLLLSLVYNFRKFPESGKSQQ